MPDVCSVLPKMPHCYAIRVVIGAMNLSPMVIAEKIQAVYDDDLRAPDGSFAVTVERGLAFITFYRDLSADYEVIEGKGLSFTEQTAVDQLALEFEFCEGDSPVIARIGEALKGRVAAIACLHESVKGFYVDESGFTRRVESPGFGMHCHLYEDNVRVDVLDSRGQVVQEAVFYPSIEALTQAGVIYQPVVETWA